MRLQLRLLQLILISDSSDPLRPAQVRLRCESAKGRGDGMKVKHK